MADAAPKEPAAPAPAGFQAGELARLMQERWSTAQASVRAKAAGVREHSAQTNGAAPPVNAWGQSKLHIGGNFLQNLADKLNAQSG